MLQFIILVIILVEEKIKHLKSNEILKLCHCFVGVKYLDSFSKI